MIYITGDCHGNFERFEPYIFPEQAEMTKDDYVIICGDFGGVWELDTDDEQWREQIAGNKHNARVKFENMQLDWRESRSFTTLYVDGEKKASVASKEAVQDILGKHSIFQIGKGNDIDQKNKAGTFFLTDDLV